MPLQPFIASYVPEAGAAAHRVLTDEVVGLVEAVARDGGNPPGIPPAVLRDLEELNVLRDDAGRIRLATSVFLEEDIRRIVEAVGPETDTLVTSVAEAGRELMDAGPELRLFLGGVIGIALGAGRAAMDESWRRQVGRYPQTRVDFIERCPSFAGLGPDVLNRSVIRGERYTAVFIGPAGHAFKTFTCQIGADEASQRFRGGLNRYLADAYAMLLTGETVDESLLATAGPANLLHDGAWRSAVVTGAVYAAYESAVRRMAEAAAAWYDDTLPAFRPLLAATVAGRQGVPPETMLTNLRRIVRTMTAHRLYASGFFTDDLRQRGTLTVFYANDVRPLRDALG